MRFPRMSTGAWIFATAALVVAVGAPVSYAAVTSTVAIGNTANSNTAQVFDSHLLTSPTYSQDEVSRYAGVTPGQCETVYTPPAGKAIVLTAVTYDMASGTAGTEAFDILYDNCTSGGAYDIADTTQAYDTFQHTFPTGLPLTGVAVSGSGGVNNILTFTGYLIPATQLPPTSQIPQISRQRLAKLHPAMARGH